MVLPEAGLLLSDYTTPKDQALHYQLPLFIPYSHLSSALMGTKVLPPSSHLKPSSSFLPSCLYRPDPCFSPLLPPPKYEN